MNKNIIILCVIVALLFIFMPKKEVQLNFDYSSFVDGANSFTTTTNSMYYVINPGSRWLSDKLISNTGTIDDTLLACTNNEVAQTFYLPESKMIIAINVYMGTSAAPYSPNITIRKDVPDGTLIAKRQIPNPTIWALHTIYINQYLTAGNYAFVIEAGGDCNPTGIGVPYLSPSSYQQGKAYQKEAGIWREFGGNSLWFEIWGI